jgi:hypothetical protein
LLSKTAAFWELNSTRVMDSWWSFSCTLMRDKNDSEEAMHSWFDLKSTCLGNAPPSWELKV